MKLNPDDFKKAFARVIYDLINADGVIDDGEIGVLQELKKKYDIRKADIFAAQGIATTDAFQILADWFEEIRKEKVVWLVGPMYRKREVMDDLVRLSRCDGRCDENEGKYLAALEMCLDDSALAVKCNEEALRFSRREAIYLGMESERDICNYISEHLYVLESCLAVYGYDFVYIPGVVELLRKKAESGLLGPILMFARPLDVRESEIADVFVNKIRRVTIESFTRDFYRLVGIREWLPSCLLVKFKTSKVTSPDGPVVRYADLIAIRVAREIIDAVRDFTGRILEYTGGFSTRVTCSKDEALYAKGFHKTLIDYVVGQPKGNSIERIVFCPLHKDSYVSFVSGDRRYMVTLSAKEIVIYMLVAVYSMGVMNEELLADIFNKLYSYVSDADGDYTASQAQFIRNIKKKLADENLPNMSLFEPKKRRGDLFYHMKFNMDYAYIKLPSTGEVEPLRLWLGGRL